MEKAEELGQAEAEGVAIARESLAAAQDLIQGAYIYASLWTHIFS